MPASMNVLAASKPAPTAWPRAQFGAPACRLAAMTELQREFELATRAEQRQRELERQRLLKKTPVSGPRSEELRRTPPFYSPPALPPSALAGAAGAVADGELAGVRGLLGAGARHPLSPPPARDVSATPRSIPPPLQGDIAEKAEKAAAKAAKRVSGRSKSGREEREEAAKKSAMEELKAARERKARGAEER